MRGFQGNFSKIKIKFCVIWVVVVVNVHAVGEPVPASNVTGPTHPGAARQMYGSGSLRPSGRKPILATGQRRFDKNPTTPPQVHQMKYIPLQPYPVLPLPISIDEYLKSRVEEYPKYPIYYPHDIIPLPRSDRPSNRGGMYGGRPEYYQGRPNHGIPDGRYPFDFGFLPGKGYEPGGHEYDSTFLGFHESDLLTPEEYFPESYSVDDQIGQQSPHLCRNNCKSREFFCPRSCTCIKDEHRCDGHVDCEQKEDELECGENLHSSPKCDDTKNFLLCPKTKRCILKDWLCDGDDDCGDFSDETHCGYQKNCTADQFQCDNGLCVPKSWTCDNDNDCRDFSDEQNCTRRGCGPGEFECGDTTCISLAWKCDRHSDCSDGSDESDCDFVPTFCNDKEFQCASHKCIKAAFKCDGDDDCDDLSDEDDCPKIVGECVAGEFKCKSGKCIPERYVCDKQKDCEQNEDEAECDYSINKPCSSDEHTCSNGACILKTWVCDGLNDCPDGEDEAKCEIVCDESKIACTGPGPNDTATAFCLNKKYRCDGRRDCPKGDDEADCPSKRDCERGTPCRHLCITTVDGTKGCACLNGFKLAADGYSCEDINECLYATDPVCSQKCNNTIGSFRCSCMTGYVLRPDLRTCKAVGAPPTLLFANRIDIRQMSLSNSKYTALLKGLHNAISLDYHYEKKMIFWSDVSMDTIKTAYTNGTGTTVVIKSGLESPGGIAIDWIHDLIFWTDSGTKRVEAATLDGKQRTVIAANELDKPRAIVVHPGEVLVFWTDWGPNPKIERCEMDGSNRRSIITESVFWPNGLALDYTNNQIYWADAKHNVIETALLDGSNRKKVISKGLPHPFAITIFEDAIFWTDWHTKAISTANKITGAGFRTIHSQLHFPMDIHSYHPQRQPKYKNRCGTNNGGCAHICLPNRKSFTCVCQMGQKVRPDKKTCQKPDKFLLFAKKKDLRIKHLDGWNENQYEMVIPMSGVKSAVSVAWDSKTDRVYWSDLATETLNRAYWNGSNKEVLVQSNIKSPAGISFDWLTDKIYWTDSGFCRIEVANADGSMRSLLLWENLDNPRDIIVHPLGGIMFWSDWGEKPKIERANMDGTNRMVIATNNLTWPNGLAVDHLSGKIYWTDGGVRTIEYANLDGSGRKTLLDGGSIPHPFGLDVFGNHIYWTDWETKSIEKANKITGGNRTVICKNLNDLMGVKVFHRNRKMIRNPCSINNGGCTDLCLLKPKGHSCACPTGIVLADDKKSCPSGPTNFLIFAHRVDIRVISLDVPYMADVVLPLTHLKLATSVDVDRKTGEIYWTDTAEDTIQKAYPDGRSRKLIIKHEIDAPEGIAIDSTGRKLYWTDGERNSIEVSELNGTNRKLLFHKNLDKPRAITLHYHHGLMFWSDWGKEPKIEVAHMDGTNRKTLILDNLAWPNGLAIDRPSNRLYWNDGKLHTIESSELNGEDRRVIVTGVPHPYGLVVVGNHIYWTDWQTQALHRADKTSGLDRAIIRSTLEGLMDIRSVQNDNTAENACGENNGGCSHLCLRNPTSYTCACPTGLRVNASNPKTCELIPEKFLLVATRQGLSQVTLGNDDVWDTTLAMKDDIQNVISVDIHWEKKLIFYGDIDRNVIKSVSMYNLSDFRTVATTNISSPNTFSVDWIANNIYWTNSITKVIEVARLDGSSRKTIVKDGLHDPRCIAVNPKIGFLFWADWLESKIERSLLDGSSRKIIVGEDLNFPIGLTIDDYGKRIYWIDGRVNEERIDTTDFLGRNRIIHPLHNTHPFALALHEEYIYWTDWVKKCVVRAQKATGSNTMIARPQLENAMGITMATKDKQSGWNPCAVDNGACTNLCFYKRKTYICECPDEFDKDCKTVPQYEVPLKCPSNNPDCGTDPESVYYDDRIDNTQDPNKLEKDADTKDQHSRTFYIISTLLMLFLTTGSLTLIVYLLKWRYKPYIYGTGRSFSNPNYYTPNNESTASESTNMESRQFIWKRLKYDKSQEKVYEETVITGNPEVASLIPTILTPCSSNCEMVTPDMERSPSFTPLHNSTVVEIFS